MANNNDDDDDDSSKNKTHLAAATGSELSGKTWGNFCISDHTVIYLSNNETDFSLHFCISLTGKLT